MADSSAVKKLKKLVKLAPPKMLVPIVIGVCLLTVGIVLPFKTTSLKQNPYSTDLPHQITVPKVTKLTVVPKTTPTSSTSTQTPAATTTTTTTTSPTSSASTPQTTPALATAPSPGTGVSGLSSSGSSGSGSSGQSGSNSNSSPPVSYTSENWSGYLTTGGNFSSVSAAWVVPAATGNGSSVSADASWIGIGGVSSDDLIQVGTQNTVEPNGQVSSSAFYELLPASAQNITTISISAGNDMSAVISEVSAGEWSITITNETNSQTFTTDVAYSSSNSSAEWIEEDPSYISGRLVPLDDFGSVSFTNCLTTDNGTSENISAASGGPVTMVNRSNQDIAVPSALTGSGNSFSVNWQSPG